LSTALSASAYFFRHFGWADLLASLPFPQLKVLRIFRLARVYRLLRTVGIRAIGRTLVRDRASSALYVLLLMGILALQFRSLTMLAIEQNADGASITTASDALWYTISTVGYGDQCAVTNVRRLFAVVIIIVGVGIFGTFTGYLATVFLSPKATDAEPEAAIVSDASATVPTEGHTASVEELRRRGRNQRRSSPKSNGCSCKPDHSTSDEPRRTGLLGALVAIPITASILLIIKQIAIHDRTRRCDTAASAHATPLRALRRRVMHSPMNLVDTREAGGVGVIDDGQVVHEEPDDIGQLAWMAEVDRMRCVLDPHHEHMVVAL
jgi:hypothetical protein